MHEHVGELPFFRQACCWYAFASNLTAGNTTRRSTGCPPCSWLPWAHVLPSHLAMTPVCLPDLLRLQRLRQLKGLPQASMPRWDRCCSLSPAEGTGVGAADGRPGVLFLVLAKPGADSVLRADAAAAAGAVCPFLRARLLPASTGPAWA